MMTKRNSESFDLFIDVWEEQPATRGRKESVIRGRVSVSPNSNSVRRKPLKLPVPLGQFALQLELWLKPIDRLDKGKNGTKENPRNNGRRE